MTDKHHKTSTTGTESHPSPDERDLARRGLSLWKKGQLARADHQAELAKIPVELQVIDVDHARSAEVIEFAIRHLSTGGTWDELRRKFGLGPSAQDKRWRAVRGSVCDGLVPKTEEEALKAQADMREFLLEKVNSFIEDVEVLLQHLPDNEEDRKLLPNFMKLRLEGIKTLLDENKVSFEAYVELKKAKNLDHKTQGASVIIQNNYHINRPGQTPREVSEVVKKSANILNPQVAIGSSNRSK